MSVQTTDNAHWGKWVQARGAAVGLLQKSALARAVGCTDTQLANWLKMPQPPVQMRKGFDQSLARALKVDAQTLFADYAITDPSSKTLEAPEPVEDTNRLRAEIVHAVELLDENRLKGLRWLLLGAA